jgi:hypothetical protein
MMLTGEADVPWERTLFTTLAVAAFMEALQRPEQPLDTPRLHAGYRVVPILKSRPLPDFDPASEEAVVSAFAQAESVTLGQAWREAPQPELRPTRAYVGHRDGRLWVMAEMKDSDIFNAATADNEWTWRLGDVFEIFLQTAREEAYTEIHVTPENRRLLLLFPDR